MKLTDKYIDKYLADFRYELTCDQLKQDWILDENPYYKEKNCWKFHAEDGCWLEVADSDVDKAFVDSENLDIESMAKAITNANCQSKYLNESFLAGVEHEKKIAIEAGFDLNDYVIYRRGL